MKWLLVLLMLPSYLGAEKNYIYIGRSATEKSISLTLFFHDTNIKLGENLFFGVMLENLSKEPFIVYDKLFLTKQGYAFNLRDATKHKLQGLYFIVTDQDGNPVEPLRHRFNACQQDITTVKTKPRKSIPSMASLKPGSSTNTFEWVFPGVCPGMRKNVPKAVPGFAELYNYQFDKPGKYYISAAYESRAPCRQPGEKIDKYCEMVPTPGPGEVFLQTPPIEVEVVR